MKIGIIVEMDRTLIRKRFHDVKKIMLRLDEYEKACETTTTIRSFYLSAFVMWETLRLAQADS